MIIDTHCHFWVEELMSDELKEILIAFCRQHGFDAGKVLDGKPERLVEEMDEAGIDKAVILPLDYGLKFEGKVDFRYYNDYAARVVKEYPDKIIGFAGIDPRRGKEAISELERCVSKLELNGVKIWQLVGFYVDDPGLYDFYEKVADLDVAVLFHTGGGPPGTYMKYNNPVHVDKVAVDFPEMRIVMAHVGNPWINEALVVAAKNPNVYVDISAWELAAKKAPFALVQMLVTAKLICGMEKVLFGSDWPLFTPLMSLRDWVEFVKGIQLPPSLQLLNMPEISEDEKRLLLGENAKRFLKL